MHLLAGRFRLYVVVAAVIMTSSSGSIGKASSVDLREHHQLSFSSTNPAQGLGASERAGDVNGDGYRDIILGAFASDFNDRKNSGAAWVVFGPFSDGQRDVRLVGQSGFRIEGAGEGDLAGLEVGGAGDVNGDGLDDVLIAAPYATNGEGNDSGVTYVVFGKSSTKTIDLLDFHDGTQGSAGFRIDGAGFRSLAGEVVDDVGDMNDDGLNDMIVGAPFAGSTYVVFGKTDMDPVDLGNIDGGLLGTPKGFRIAHRSPPTNSEMTYGTSGVGDVNGDGVPDVYVDVCYVQTAENRCWRNRAWVVFGKANGDEVNVEELGSGGFAIKDAQGGSGLSLKPGGSGDVNGDGKADIIVLHKLYAKRAYVVFGKANSETVYLTRLGDRGYRIQGWSDENPEPFMLRELYFTSAAGDVNRDGTPDALISAQFASPHGRDGAGSVFVVYGKRKNREAIKLRHLNNRGYRIDGAKTGTNLGRRVTASQDLNGDHRPDQLMNISTGIQITWGRRF